MIAKSGLALGLSLAVATVANAQPAMLGADAAACTSGEGPAIQANIEGLKDRKGELKLELYPPDEADFLKDDNILIAQGKLFRRIRVSTPPSGAVSLCIRVPKPGRYALLFTHNRDGKNKFSFWNDGAGFPSNHRIGRARPKLEGALIEVGKGIVVTNIRTQYLHGLGGFSPS